MANPKRPRDANQLAKTIVDISIGEIEEEPESVKAKSGRIGGLKGGHARAENRRSWGKNPTALWEPRLVRGLPRF